MQSGGRWPPLVLPLLGSNQDSPDPESGVLPVTPRGTVPKDYTVGSAGRARANTTNAWGRGEVGAWASTPTTLLPRHGDRAVHPTSPLPHIPTPLSRSGTRARHRAASIAVSR